MYIQKIVYVHTEVIFQEHKNKTGSLREAEDKKTADEIIITVTSKIIWQIKRDDTLMKITLEGKIKEGKRRGRQ